MESINRFKSFLCSNPKMKEKIEKLKSNKKAFTLIELIIVIAIIGVLVAMIMPNFAKNTEDAQIARAKSDIRLISSAAQLYSAQTGRFTDMQGKVTGAVCDKLTTIEEASGYGPWLVSCPVSPWEPGGKYIYKIGLGEQEGTQIIVVYMQIPSGKYIISTDLSKLHDSEPTVQ